MALFEQMTAFYLVNVAHLLVPVIVKTDFFKIFRLQLSQRNIKNAILPNEISCFEYHVAYLLCKSNIRYIGVQRLTENLKIFRSQLLQRNIKNAISPSKM